MENSRPALPTDLQEPCTTGRTPELESAFDMAVKMLGTGPEAHLLSNEFAVFKALVYRSKSQHRRTLSFRRLLEVFSYCFLIVSSQSVSQLSNGIYLDTDTAPPHSPPQTLLRHHACPVAVIVCEACLML